MASIAVLGGAGYIGSHMAKMLREAGHFVVGLDSLENGFRDAINADAVVIGSRLVQLLESEPRDNVARAAGAFVAEIRTALDAIAGESKA